METSSQQTQKQIQDKKDWYDSMVDHIARYADIGVRGIISLICIGILMLIIDDMVHISRYSKTLYFVLYFGIAMLASPLFGGIHFGSKMVYKYKEFLGRTFKT